MLRVIQPGTGRPISYPADPNDSFQPGMIAQVKMVGNDTVMGVSDGRAPMGIIDDIRDSSFTRPAIDEIVIIKPAIITGDGYGNYVSGADAFQVLNNAHIIQTSFVANIPGLSLNEMNGVIHAPPGIKLNYAVDGSVTPNAIRAIVSYAYRVANMPGEDTTLGSGRITIWFTRGIFQTDQYEMGSFPVNANLYVSPNGKLTTEMTIPNQPAPAMVISSPASHNAQLEFLWW